MTKKSNATWDIIKGGYCPTRCYFCETEFYNGVQAGNDYRPDVNICLECVDKIAALAAEARKS